MAEPTDISPDGIPAGNQGNINEQSPLPERKLPDATPEVVETPKVEVVDTPKSEKVETEGDIDFTSFLDAKSKTQEVKKPTVKPEAPKVPETKPDARDISDLDPEIAPLFKQMSNDAFNRLKPIVLEYKKAKEALAAKDTELAAAKKGSLPDNYYEHPQAFVLTPEFNQASSNISTLQRIADHWKQQLAKVKDGAGDVDIIDLNEKGELFVSGKAPADSSTETELLTYINHAQNQLFQERGKLSAIVQAHKSKHGEISQWISEHEKIAFPAFDDPKNTTGQQLLNDVINRFPPALRSNPIIRLTAKSLITNNTLFKKIKDLEEKLGTPSSSNGSKVSEDKRKAGPTSSEAVGDVSKKSNESEVTFDDFEARKRL